MSVGNLTVTNARIFNGFDADMEEGAIRIAQGDIVEAGHGVRPGNDDELIDARGAVVTPGFIDNHMHAYGVSLNMMEMEASPTSWVALKGSRRLESALKRGFTTVRDVAGGDIGLKMAIEQDIFPAPNYYFTGPALSQTGGHGDPRSAHLDVCCSNHHGVEIVDGVDNLRVAVRERLRTGAHAIKIMASGGVVSLTDPIRIPQYSGEEIRAVTEEASRRGSYVAAHAYSPEAITHAVRNGVRSIEHGNLLDAESADEMRKAGAVLVPTLVTYFAMAKHGSDLGMAPVALGKNAQVLQSGQSAVELAMSVGIPVGFGSDLMGDLEYMQLSGIPLQHEVQGTLELLRSLTSRNAQILGVERHGRVAPGCTGDLLILPGDPFVSPSVLWEESPDRIVIKSGRRIVG
ncbi:MAG: amidohydrolase family protein [Candidatus Nanopelagicales bacterium]